MTVRWRQFAALALLTCAPSEAGAAAVEAHWVGNADEAVVCVVGPASKAIEREAGIVLTLVGRDGRRHGTETVGEGKMPFPARLPLPADWPVAGGRLTIEIGLCDPVAESCLPVELELRIPDDRRSERPAGCGG